jgi:hypothetical protein
VINKLEPKEIPDYPDYYVDIEGNVYSTKPYRNNAKPETVPRLMKKQISENGYYYISLTNHKNKIKRKVHQLVLETFVGSCPEGMEACHNNGDRLDNKLKNLRWDTHKNNMKDAIKQGKTKASKEYRQKRSIQYSGEGNPYAKLNNQQVRIIRSFNKLNQRPTYQEIGKIFGVTKSVISSIMLNKSYKGI